MRKLYFAVGIIIQLLGSAFADEKISSKWSATEIKIDGGDSEWVDGINYLEKEKLGFGIKNDSSYLYLCLKFESDIQRQAKMFGFTIWFDSAGKNKKEFGIHFPIGLQNFDTEPPPEPKEPGEYSDDPQQRFAPMLQEIEVLGPEKEDRNRFSVGGSFGIRAASSESQTGHFVCELKIPLKSIQSQPYAIGSELGKTLSVGFEMGEMDRDKMRERMRSGGGFGGGRPPDGDMPRGGGRPGGFPGGGRPNGMNRPNPFKVWKQVTLSTSETVSQ